jgi:succinylarginine dihydrolase
MMATRAHEVNFDGIVGPTHNYAGLSYGNLASTKNKLTISHPRQAALEGLAKMKLLMEQGVHQGLLPPQERPYLPMLRRLGFTGGDARIIESPYKHDPRLLASCTSASSMWAANAATVSPSADSADGHVHFTAANLTANFHRSIESPQTALVLKRIFSDDKFFVHHDPLPATPLFSDEGAANHMRLASSHGEPGLEIFVHGRRAAGARSTGPRKFPARQSSDASSAIARLHQLHADRILLIPQNPRAIDAGAFHNDVVAVANLNVLFHHELAFEPGATRTIAATFSQLTGMPLKRIEVKDKTIPLREAIKTYLFNSQLVSLPKGGMAMIAPSECHENPRVKRYLDRLLAKADPITAIHYVDVRQSMHNGGGPACLRLRIVLTEGQLMRMHPGVLLTDALFERLVQWIRKHYRQTLAPRDLADPKLLDETRAALDELTRILQLGSIYDFQRS